MKLECNRSRRDFTERHSDIPWRAIIGMPVDTLGDGAKVKRRLPRMRACNEKDAKDKLCAGHLKRWYFFGEEVKHKFGPDAEIYRCEHCKTLYLPNREEAPRTRTLSY